MSGGRVLTATRLGFLEQARRPLLIVLLVVVPFYFISRSIAITLPTPQPAVLPGGEVVLTTMRDIHGAVMVTITVAFLAGLCGEFVMQSAHEADRRLVVAGYRPFEAIAPRLAVLAAATLLVLVVSLLVTALDFSPQQWVAFAAGNLLAGVIYGLLGAIAGALLGRLGATYAMFFLPMVDIGIAQNPMFGDGGPDAWAAALPGWGPTRIVVDAAFSGSFDAGLPLAISLAWVLGLAIAVGALLSRSLGAGEARWA